MLTKSSEETGIDTGCNSGGGREKSSGVGVWSGCPQTRFAVTGPGRVSNGAGGGGVSWKGLKTAVTLGRGERDREKRTGSR